MWTIITDFANGKVWLVGSSNLAYFTSNVMGSYFYIKNKQTHLLVCPQYSILGKIMAFIEKEFQHEAKNIYIKIPTSF